MTTRLFAAISILVLAIAAAPGQTPLGNAFTYQGRLENAAGPVNGLHDLRFTLYSAASGGSVIAGPVCSDNVNIANGLFTVPIDFGAADVNFNGQARWVAIEVRADTTPGNCAGGAYTPLTQRQPLTAAPYALYAQAVPVPFTLSGTSATHIIRAENASTGFLPMAIYGLCSGASGGTTGVRGESASVNGRGVIGFATAATGTTYGGQFESTSTTGRGVYGNASAGSGSNFGGYFESASTAGRGVFGQATAATGGAYGGRFESASTSGYGVFGYASASVGTNFGVFGRSDSPDGFAGYFTGGKNYFEGSLGIGTNSPDAKLHVVGGSDAEPGSGGFIVAGLTTSTNVAIDSNEIMARNNGATAPLALNANGGNVNLIQAGTGSVGIGTSSPSAKLDVNGAARVDSLEVNGGAIRVVGAGAETNTAAFIHVVGVRAGLRNFSQINHPLCNGRPDALLFITVRHSVGADPFPVNTLYMASYSTGYSRWSIQGDTDFDDGQQFNVLIILP